MITKQSIYKEKNPDSKLFVCEYPNCNNETEFKANGKIPLCSEHHSLYIFIKDLIAEVEK